MTLYIFFSIFESCSFKPLNYVLSFFIMFSIFTLCFPISKYVLFAAELCFDILHCVFHFNIMFSMLGIVFFKPLNTFIEFNIFDCFAELCSAYGLVHCSRKATSNPGSRKLPAFSIIYVNILTMPASFLFLNMVADLTAEAISSELSKKK